MFSTEARRARRPLPTSGLFLLLCVGALACGPGAVAGAPSEGTETETGAVAKVADVELSRSELLTRASNQLDAVELERAQCEASSDKKRHEVLEANLEQMIRESLRDLAAEAAGRPGAEWLLDERTRRAAALPAAEIEQFIQGNPRLARAQPAQMESIRGQVRNFLAEEAIFAELHERYEVDTWLEPYRVEIEAIGPSKGPDSAVVTIVEFSDFECPYCKRVVPTIDRAVEKYGDKLRPVFRQFPLNSIHARAQKAAEASLCADEQGEFWALHDHMFSAQAKLDVEELVAAAGGLGLDGSALKACVDSGRYADRVAEDLRAGALVGVTGTPAMFVNGRPMSGAVSFEALSAVIDDELERANR